MNWEDEETQYATDSDAYSGSDEEEVDYVVEDDDTSTSHQKPYTILTETDIRLRQDEDIAAVSNVLSVSTVSASNMLRQYNWNVNRVQEAWFEDEEKVRKTVGLVDRPVFRIQRDRNYKCKICLDMYNYNSMDWADCGHPFCVECLKRYISVAIADGPGCLVLRCPEPDCVAAIGQDMVNKLGSDEYREKYVNYLVRSYVEVRQRTKWCPAPGCDYAVDFDTDSSESYNVKCKCSNFFCWNCGEEAHTPVDCDTVAKWIFKNSDEAENTQWILANSKPCPKCKNPIEKNQGCMHMTCRAPCKFEFCWLCLGAWSKHGEKTGGFYACNVYRKEESEVDESERIRERAKMYIERYAHHYERWLANHNSRQKAIDDLQKVQTNQITKLVEKQNQPEAQLKFIIEAWQQIVECRRVLKWTYAYGYYLPDDEHAKRQLFEYFQGEAESGLERLHNCVEKEVEVFLDATSPSNDFIDFHEKLAGLTRVTRNYFENLVQALENGLSDVYS